MEQLMTSEEVAESLHVDPVTIRRLINKGELSAYRVGADYRLSPKDVDNYLQRQRVSATAESTDLNSVLNQISSWMLKKFQNTSGPNQERFDRFTNRARRAMALAQEEAQNLHHNYIGTEHLLLGLMGEGECIAARALRNMDVSLEQIRSDIKLISGLGPQITHDAIGLTPRAKKVIELAVDEARNLKHNFLGTEHILLGIIREGQGLGVMVLQKQGIKLEQLRDETLTFLQQYLPDGSNSSKHVLSDSVQVSEEGAAMLTSTRVCANCGSTNADHFNYCYNCGQELVVDEGLPEDASEDGK